MHEVIHIIHKNEQVFLWIKEGLSTYVCFVKKDENDIFRKNIIDENIRFGDL